MLALTTPVEFIGIQFYIYYRCKTFFYFVFLASYDVQNHYIYYIKKEIIEFSHMKIISTLLLSFLPTLAIFRCIHDQVVSGKKMVPINDTQIHQHRLLQSLGYGPMRFHLQYDPNSVNADDAIGKNIMKIMNIIVQFWSQTIEIDYAAALSFQIPPNFDPDKFKCLSFLVPRRLIDSPTPNKDYGLLIEGVDDGDSGVTAYSYPCAYSMATNKPIWGMVHWNKHYMSFNPLNFQQNIYIGIHEVLHIIGFSQALYSNYKNSGVFTSSSEGVYLTGPYIREEVKKQYGCSNPPGMTLQTNGGSGTAYSHWSRKTAMNELMTAGVSVNNPTISYITLALLQQTGWYRKIYKNHGKFINFGYQKGCSMLNASDCSSDQYCLVQDEKMPDYDKTALGYCKNDSLTNCMYVKYYVNFICTDPNYSQKSLHATQGVIGDTGQVGSKKSRCFSSNLRLSGKNQTKYSFRCYQVLCTPSSRTLTIRIGNKFAFCLFPNQQIKVSGYDGTLLCPSSFQAVCAMKRCPKQCNANGVCLNGKCLCAPEYTGEGCEKLSSVGYASRVSLFDIEQNNNCIEGSYLNQFGSCELCPSRCSRCSRYDVCQLCVGGKLPNDGKC